MTMGFRNRPRPEKARYDCSPTTGRIVVGIVCVVALVIGTIIFPLCIPLALLGLYLAIFVPKIFE